MCLLLVDLLLVEGLDKGFFCFLIILIFFLLGPVLGQTLDVGGLAAVWPDVDGAGWSAVWPYGGYWWGDFLIKKLMVGGDLVSARCNSSNSRTSTWWPLTQLNMVNFFSIFK